MSLGARVVSAAVASAAYGYWATGQAPFGDLGYLAVGVPVALVVCSIVLARGGPAGTRHRAVAVTAGSAWPWLVIAAVIVGLEGVGLALGGRSAAVPTLSTVVDHALGWHLSRLLLFLAWLLIGWRLVGVVRSDRRRLTR